MNGLISKFFKKLKDQQRLNNKISNGKINEKINQYNN